MLSQRMKFHILWPFAFGALVLLSINSCTKTVVQTQTDTLRSTDTLHDTLGPHEAWIQFLSMFPDSITRSILISTTPDANSTLLTVAQNSIDGRYLPLRADSSYMLYLSTPSLPGWQDSLPIPQLGNTLNTYALFLVDPLRMEPGRSVDSEKLTPPPPGYCYVRFVNGIPDAPSISLALDTLGKSLFPNNGNFGRTDFESISPYALVRAGTHSIYLESQGNPPLQRPNNSFKEGYWYTVRATGSIKENNAQIGLDPE